MRSKIRRYVIITVFALYVLIMLYFLLFGMHRSMFIGLGFDAYWIRVRSFINLIPFATVRQLVNLLKNSGNEYFVRFAFVNILGNIVMFIPFGLLLPCIFKRQRKCLRFVLTAVLTVLCVEVVQAFTLLGSGDIDDLILNVLGSLIGFAIWKIPIINRLLSKFGLLL